MYYKEQTDSGYSFHLIAVGCRLNSKHVIIVDVVPMHAQFSLLAVRAARDRKLGGRVGFMNVAF